MDRQCENSISPYKTQYAGGIKIFDSNFCLVGKTILAIGLKYFFTDNFLICGHLNCFITILVIKLGPVVQSIVSLTSLLRVISLTVLVDSIYNILIFFAEKMCSFYIFFSKKFQHICVLRNINFYESLTNDVVSFEQLGPGN